MWAAAAPASPKVGGLYLSRRERQRVVKSCHIRQYCENSTVLVFLQYDAVFCFSPYLAWTVPPALQRSFHWDDETNKGLHNLYQIQSISKQHPSQPGRSNWCSDKDPSLASHPQTLSTAFNEVYDLALNIRALPKHR